ncbi:hypothetical protein AYO44_10780 [Planctomycetaceae bacterium SCGC AG-212-F19]|nr:hypothetical protein AYO44_10780 [Planctomycetaceae bacterium SCGC AG-212-F19]
MRNYLAAPVDGASLALFRICFGLVMVWEVLMYLWPRAHGNWVHLFFTDAAWNFPFAGFAWVRPWSEPFLTIHFILLGLAGLCVALGLCYRCAAVAMTVLWTYVFLLDEALYLNHAYLMCLLSFLLIAMPAQACFSVDCWLARRRMDDADQPADSIPFWPVFLLRAQLFIVYFYGGIAKLNGDWLTGTPLNEAGLKMMLALSDLLPLTVMQALRGWVGPMDIARFLAIGGLFFDLGIGFLLIWRRGRLLALLLLAIFHGLNSQTFRIGVFPVMAFTGSLIFCAPDWPRRFWNWLRSPRVPRSDRAWLIAGALAMPMVGGLLGWKLPAITRRASNRAECLRYPLLGFMAVWLALQLLLPLRHYALPGPTEWTEEHGRFAWRMMARWKEGDVQFSLFDPGLYSTDAQGRTRINWAEWTRKYPRVVYVPVDAANLDPRRWSGCVVVFEPLLGERMVVNARAAPGARPPTREQIAAEWRAAYGRVPEICPIVSVAGAIEALTNELASRNRAVYASATKAAFRLTLDQARQLAAQRGEAMPQREAVMAALGDRLAGLLSDGDFGPIVHRHLARTPPLALQGGPPDGDWFIIEDAGMQTLDGHNRWQLDRTAWKGSNVVYADFSRTTHATWATLPSALVLEQGGFPYVIWNHHAELKHHQIDQFVLSPVMIHQYAQRIACMWTEAFGRRPAVHVTTSLVSLNLRPAQTMIDPRVDLAAVPFTVLGHNDWILPFREDPAALCLLPPGGQGMGNPTAKGARIVRGYPNGQVQCAERAAWRDGKACTVSLLWYESGLPASCAEEGGAGSLLTQWHPNGQPYKQLRYANGKLQGEAKMWYPNGRPMWEGAFMDGQLAGHACGWDGSGGLVQQGEFGGRAGEVQQVNYQAEKQAP